jgi:hypothetical protein
MNLAFNQIIENIKGLSAEEKALVAHCLIASLEAKQDAGVDEAWAKLAEKRFAELESGVVKGVSWGEIRQRVKGENA